MAMTTPSAIPKDDTANMSVCATCQIPLTLAVNDDDNEDGTEISGRTVPDDVELSCGCHYHWYEGLLSRVVWLSGPKSFNVC